MARKTKAGIDYFSHDVDMIQDKKIKLVIAKHGIVGYAIYLRLLEELYRENGYYLTIDEDFNILFADEINVDMNVYQGILAYCVEKGLFDKALYETYNIITSVRIQTNFCSATERRKEVEFIKEYLLIDPLEKYNVTKINVYINSLNDDINGLNVDIGTQSKVKESKVNKSKVKTTTSEVIHSVNEKDAEDRSIAKTIDDAARSYEFEIDIKSIDTNDTDSSLESTVADLDTRDSKNNSNQQVVDAETDVADDIQDLQDNSSNSSTDNKSTSQKKTSTEIEKSLFSEESFEMRCVDYLINQIRELNPNARLPSRPVDKQKWAVHIDKLRRLDHKPDAEIAHVLEYATTNTFWRANILSTSKFRDKYDTLFAQMKRPITKNQDVIEQMKDW